jgi:hypothetical protein
MLEGKLAFTSIPSLCNVFMGNVVVFVLEKTFVSVLEGKITCANFPSLCNVGVGNVVVLVLERKLSSWCNVVVGNVLKGKLASTSFPS